MGRPLAQHIASDEDFVKLYSTYGPSEAARRLKIAPGSVFVRARLLRMKGVAVDGPSKSRRGQRARSPEVQGEARVELDVENGHVIVASDPHYWPGERTLLHRALCAMAKDFRPIRAIILNGDVMDLPRISRFAPIGWEKRPEVSEEIEWAQDMTHAVAVACGRAERIWNLGNHDARFETRLATIAPEYAKVHGVHLKDHFPLWRPAWSTFINGEVLVKHRFRGGIHAVHNNLLWSGVHIVTGHLHSAQVRALTLYDDRTTWGVDAGCLAEPNSRAFVDWTEDNPKNWRSAFVLLTFRAGRLMMPELILAWDKDHVQFRGEIFRP
jgi:hypothetical protein